MASLTDSVVNEFVFLSESSGVEVKSCGMHHSHVGKRNGGNVDEVGSPRSKESENARWVDSAPRRPTVGLIWTPPPQSLECLLARHQSLHLLF